MQLIQRKNTAHLKARLALTSLLIFLLYCLYAPALGTEAEISIHDRSLPSGPWGNLQISYIQIGPPIDFVPELRTINRPRSWQFPDWNTGQLRDFLLKAPLTEPIR